MKREVRLFDELDRFAGSAPITHAMALTYCYSGDVANERIWRPLVERSGVRHPLVIADGQVTDAGTSLSVHVLRARRPSGVFHPKLFLALREDAVFVAIGSANLTSGGLGQNLELMAPLIFARDAEWRAPKRVLLAVLEFLRLHVVEGLRERVSPSSLEVADDIIRHAQLVADVLPDRTRDVGLAFLHSYETSIWDQLRQVHGEDAIERLVVVSPFFEADDPATDDSNSLLRFALSDGLPWSARTASPRCTLYVGPVDSGLELPVTGLRDLGTSVAVHCQKLSVEPRKLHAKLVVVTGRKRTTVMWGSPNFTPSGLLRSAAEGGNVECALAASFETNAVPSEALEHELDLSAVFELHRGALPDPTERSPVERPIFDVGEALYDPATRELTLYIEVFDPRVKGLRAEASGTAPIVLMDSGVEGTGPFHRTLEGHLLEEIDPATGKRQLRSLYLRVVGLDETRSELGRIEVRINVRFGDALEVRQNLLLGPDVLSADALLLPSTAPPEQRVTMIDTQIAAWKAAREGEGAAVTQHQPSLDLFFRNVRNGLDARWAALTSRRGSRFALLHWADVLRRSLAAAAPSEALDDPRRLYLTLRVAEHIRQVLEAIPRWHETHPTEGFAALGPATLADALAAVPPPAIPPPSGTTLGEAAALAKAAQTTVVQQLRELA